MASPSRPLVPTPPPPLKLLSLDGGGIRGLSSLIILKHLMKRVNPDNPPKPCDYFDLIGGTSTGGLIAIMLGRLQMDIDTCIKKYCELSSAAFQRKRMKVNFLGKVKDMLRTDGKYSSDPLESEVQAIVKSVEGDAQAKLMDPNAPCKAFVCAMTKSPKTRFLFRTYTTNKAVDAQASFGCAIWEAARATSAATTFFDPIQIGGQVFVDGATGLNNPVEVVLDEAKSIWSDAISRIQCIVSIGTGVPNFRKFGNNLKEVVDTLIAISTETEDTERRFLQTHESLGVGGRYFRYNVDQGLGEVGLDEHNEVAWIIRATESYLGEPRIEKTIEAFTTASAPYDLPPLNAASKESHLKWLEYFDPLRYHNAARNSHVTESTGNWFLKGDFERWKIRPQSFLWLHGKPGCGKTILSSTIIDKIEKENLGILAYYYFSFQEKKSQEVRLLLYSLLTQLVRGLVRKDLRRHDHYHLPKAFRDLHDKYQPGSEPRSEDLNATFLGVLAESGETYIVIDALDECSESKDQEEVIKFLAMLSCKAKNTHILITSRKETGIEEAIRKEVERGINLNKIRIQNKQANDDIRTHAQARMRKDAVFKTWQPELQKRVVDHLTNNADGVFRWVKCQLDTLRRLRERTTERDIDKALRELPKDLDETYSRMLSEIDRSRYADEARAVLKWLVGSTRPLKLNEAAEAAVFCNPERDSVSVDLGGRFPKPGGIQAVLSGLVTVQGMDDEPDFGEEGVNDGHDGIISFAHFSVKEYLQCNRVEPKAFQLLESDAQSFVLQSCLAYIDHYDAKTSEETDSRRHPLLLYACKYWSHHALALCCYKDQCVLEAPVQRLTDLLTKLNGPILTLSTRVALGLKDRPTHKMLPSVLRNWLKGLEGEKSVTGLEFDFEERLALHSASRIGEKGLVKLLLDCGADVDAKGENDSTALHLAVAGGHEAVVQLLLQKGADIEIKEYGGGTPLARAIENGSEAVIELLLAKDAKVEVQYTQFVSELDPSPC